MGRIALVALLLACARKPVPETPLRAAGSVRVHLRSLGEAWREVRVEGKQGQTIAIGTTQHFSETPALLRREGGRVSVSGIRGAHRRVMLRPRGGVFTVDGHTYSGDLEVKDGLLVNHVPLENYVLGVLRGELPLPDVPQAAAEAQAMAARAYTLHYLRNPGGEAFDLDDTTLYQRYVGLDYAPDDDALRRGVQATHGLYLAHADLPLKAYYHSTCGGHTTDVRTGLDRENVPCMPGVPCEHCRASKYYRWEALVADADVARAARAPGLPERVEIAARGPGGRVRALRVTAGGNSRSVHASAFRLALGASRLRSSLVFSIEREAAGWRFRGGGWGHGVGLCQMGAVGLAHEGLSGKEIAAYYYPGAAIRRLSP